MAMTPSMTSSNSMSSGYCSLDDDSEDFSFFTARTSFFHKPKHSAQVTGGLLLLECVEEVVF